MKRISGTALAGLLVLSSAITLGAEEDDYDWRRPGEREAAAVFSAMTKGDRAMVEALLDDGLEIDQRLPFRKARIPILSLAVIADAVEVVDFLIAAGADIDLMSTVTVRDREALERHLSTLSK